MDWEGTQGNHLRCWRDLYLELSGGYLGITSYMFVKIHRTLRLILLFFIGKLCFGNKKKREREI